TSKSSWTSVPSSRHAARMILRARLRATAPPTRRLATKAASVGPARGDTYSITRSPRRERPEETTRRTSVGLRREPCPALGPASGQDGTARARAHANAEAVGPLPAAHVWLEGLLHGDRRGSIAAWLRRRSPRRP